MAASRKDREVFCLGLEKKATSGRLMMITCPMLEDEMVYNLTADPEEKKIFLLENKDTETLIPKLRMKNVDFKLISEDDFFNENANVPREGYNVIIWMMDLGLHSEPTHLASEIRQISSHDPRSYRWHSTLLWTMWKGARWDQGMVQ